MTRDRRTTPEKLKARLKRLVKTKEGDELHDALHKEVLREVL
jgi:hypothetical protein